MPCLDLPINEGMPDSFHLQVLNGYISSKSTRADMMVTNFIIRLWSLGMNMLDEYSTQPFLAFVIITTFPCLRHCSTSRIAYSSIASQVMAVLALQKIVFALINWVQVCCRERCIVPVQNYKILVVLWLFHRSKPHFLSSKLVQVFHSQIFIVNWANVCA